MGGEQVYIKEMMQWPPLDQHRWKMIEHSAWYGGDPTVLAHVYNQMLATNITGLPYMLHHDLFWARQIKNDCEVGLHVPIAGDIASLSADLLFSEPPTIKIAEAHEKKASQSFKDAQEGLNLMLDESGLFRKILECAETAAAMGGGYVKLAWDSDLSPYPIPVVEQIDNAIPVFKFGILIEVTFWKIIKQSGNGDKVHRLFETYHNDGSITYKLYYGTSDNLGKEVPVESIEEGKEYTDISTAVDDLLAVYIPNMLPNRMDRSSCAGRSDYSGLEGMMDALDEAYSSWMRDITVAQGKILIPQQYLEKSDSGFRYNVDKMVYAKLDVDPVSEDGKITPIQFAIRAEEFSKTCLNLLDRIVSSAGYSPQSIGLNIEGSAQSGTALNVRERKSFITKNKKESYWEPTLKKLVKLMLILYKTELSGAIEVDVNITTSFSDSLSNDLSETSAALQQISQAMAASTETKVRMLHTDWSEDEVMAEVEKIINENGLAQLTDPDKVGLDGEEI
jgi:A118 family predicted phage portal protein